MPRLSGILVLVKFKFWLQEIDAITPFCRILVQSPEVAGGRDLFEGEKSKSRKWKSSGPKGSPQDRHIHQTGRQTDRQTESGTDHGGPQHAHQSIYLQLCVRVKKLHILHWDWSRGPVRISLCIRDPLNFAWEIYILINDPSSQWGIKIDGHTPLDI